MKLIDQSVHRPVGVVILVLAVMILGAVSLTNLSIDLLPDINFPIAVVMTSYEGAAPQEVESLITRPLEGGLSTVQGLETIQSLSVPNQSVILLIYDFGTDMDQAMLEIRDRMDFVQQLLPDGAEEPMLLRFDPNAFPIMQLSLSGDLDTEQLSKIAHQVIIPRLERVSGVAQVNLLGEQPREFQVEVDPDRLHAHQLSLTQLAQILAAENMSTSAGTLSRGQQELSLRVIGELNNIDDLANVNLPLPTGEIVKLGEVAEIRDTLADPETYAFVNGEGTLSLNITKQSDANTVAVSEAVTKAMEALEKELPPSVQLNVIMDTSIYIRDSIQNVAENMIIGGGMAIFILLLFLRSIRSTLVIAISIPIAVISAFTLIYFAGHTLNILTMGGMALGIGLLVDSSIVILESIFKYRERGYAPLEAAKQGASEIGSAVIASTLTTVVVFLPIVFTTGIAAEIFWPLAMTVSFTLLASLVVSLTLVPMLASRLIPRTALESSGPLARLGQGMGRLIEGTGERYRQALGWAIQHRKTVLGLTLALLIASFAFVPLVGVEFMPTTDQGEIMVEVSLPAGSHLDHTRQVIHEIEEKITALPEADLIFSTVGQGMMSVGGNTANTGSLYVRLHPLNERERTTDEVMAEIRQSIETIPDVEATVSALDSAGLSESAIQIDITGDELDRLKELAQQLGDLIKSVPGVTNLSNSLEETVPQLQITIDRQLAAQYGLTQADVMQTIRLSFQGQVATVIRKEGQEIKVKLQLPERVRESVDDLITLPILTPVGETIPLEAIADIEEKEGPQVISRQDQHRGVSITADLTGERDLGSVINDIRQRLESITLPEGFSYEISGQYEQMEETFGDLTLALLLAIFLVYAVMAVQFEKVMYPFIVMFSLPPTFIGVVIGLALTGRSLSTPAFIGLVMLAGIVVNNAIILVDYINTLRRRGHARDEAILQAGQERLRPILMTTLTTILAMLPLAIGIGEGAELQAPLATVIIFGLSFSTLITLFLVPVMYIYMDRITDWFRAKQGR